MWLMQRLLMREQIGLANIRTGQRGEDEARMGMEFGLNYNLIQSHIKLFLKHALNYRQNIVQTISLYSL